MEELEVLLPSFLTLALDETEWSSSRSGRFISDIHLIGGWVGTQERVWMLGRTNNLLSLPKLEPRTVQAVA